MQIRAWLGYLAKAIFAAAAAFIGATITALAQIGEGASFSEIETLAWLTIAGTTLAAFGGVFGFSNAPKPT